MCNMFRFTTILKGTVFLIGTTIYNLFEYTEKFKLRKKHHFTSHTINNYLYQHICNIYVDIYLANNLFVPNRKLVNKLLKIFV